VLTKIHANNSAIAPAAETCTASQYGARGCRGRAHCDKSLLPASVFSMQAKSAIAFNSGLTREKLQSRGYFLSLVF
jgi:hypothetical protein